MKIEFHRCTKSGCFVPDLLDRGYIALWPQRTYVELVANLYHQWDFYVEWAPDRRGRVNKALLCHKHHNQMQQLVGQEAAGEVQVQEATDAWLAQTGNRM